MRSLTIVAAVLTTAIGTVAHAQTAQELQEVQDLLMQISVCQLDTMQWQSGDRAPFIRRYGDHAEDVIKACILGNQARESLVLEFMQKYPGVLSRFE